MNRWTLSLAACLAATAAQAELPPLSSTELARCATQIQTLRTDSVRLTQTSAQYEQRRDAINRRTVQLKAERDAVPADNLEAGLAVRERLKTHHAETVAFNAQVEQLKRDIIGINALKQDYDRGCASRSYRRADLEALPEPARNAMRIGLGDVQVPYLDPAVAPPAAR